MAKSPARKTGARKSASKRKTTARKKSIKQPQAEQPKDSCFVLMPFSDPFNVYYNQLFRPAVERSGLKPVRADDLFRPSAIVSDLWGMIQEAKVLLAELTTKNANIFYELGLAHAIGKPVVLVSETMGDVPFDLQQLRVLLYDKNDPDWGPKLARNITSAIKETLAAPVEAVPNIFRKKVESQGPEQDVVLGRLESLENQVRLLRSTPRGGLLSTPTWKHTEGELDDVNSMDEFDQWVVRWSQRGIDSSLLKSFALRSNVPDEEADRIYEIVERFRQDSP